MKKTLSLIQLQHASLFLGAVCAMSHTWAQTSDPSPKTYPLVEVVEKPLEFRQFEKVEITGSAILAKAAKQALPLQIIDRREIERSGAQSLAELIQRLPFISNFSELGSVTGTVSGGPEAAGIHGNQSGTLVLLNGRRLPYYGSQTIMGERAVVDLNFLPLTAIEKVEILTDGASSRYGSDAVAGVINVITKSDLQGFGIGVEAVLPQGGHGQSKGLNMSWGNGRLQRDGYSLRGYLTVQKTQAVLAKHRDVSSQGARSVQRDGKTWWQNYRSYGYSAPAENYRDANGDEFNTYHLQNGRCKEDWYELTPGKCQRNTQGDMTLFPETDKQLLYVQADRVLANRWILFGEGLLGRQSQISVPDGTYWTLDVDSQDRSRKYLLDLVPVGLVNQQYMNRIQNGVVGLRGEASGWDFVSTLSSGKHRVRRAYIGGLVNDRYDSAQVSPDLIFQDPSQYSAQTVAELKQYQRGTERLLDIGFTQMDSINLLASREWMQTDHGPVNVGAGLDWRRERVHYTSPNSQTRPSFDISRYVWAAHTEMTAPLGPESEVTAALRHDQYSDFGGVQTGKIGWKWKPDNPWLFRGSLGTGFRAPTMGQMVPLTTMISHHLDDETGTYIAAINAGNPKLQPERSVQKTVGIRYEPSPVWSLGADLWQVDIKDTFGILTGEQILRTPELRSKYYVDGTLQQMNQNLGRSVKRGLDFDAHWRQPTEMGRVRTSFRGVHMLKSAQQDAVSGAYINNIGQSAQPYLTTARHQFILSSWLERAQWTGGVTLHYKSGYIEKTMLTSTEGEVLDYIGRIPGHWTLDLMSRWQILSKTTLTVHGVNLTNRMPAVRMRLHGNELLGIDTRYANYSARNLQIKLDHKF